MFELIRVSRSSAPRGLMLPLLALLLSACGSPGERAEVDVVVDSDGEVRPGVILSDTALGPIEPGGRPSEALPGPGALPPSLPPAAGAPAGAPPPVAPDAAPPGPGQGAPAPAGWTVGRVRRDGGSAGVATLTQVRSGRNDGFDRIVFQFAGPALPGYNIEYVDRPVRQCGSGDVVPLPGDAWLAMRMEPARAHDDAGRGTVAQRSLSPGLPNVLEVTSICDFEGQVEWVAGVRSPTPFRVSELRDPARLVVDIRH